MGQATSISSSERLFPQRPPTRPAQGVPGALKQCPTPTPPPPKAPMHLQQNKTRQRRHHASVLIRRRAVQHALPRPALGRRSHDRPCAPRFPSGPPSLVPSDHAPALHTRSFARPRRPFTPAARHGPPTSSSLPPSPHPSTPTPPKCLGNARQRHRQTNLPLLPSTLACERFLKREMTQMNRRRRP